MKSTAVGHGDIDSNEIRILLETLLQMTIDHKMHERFYTERNFRWVADLRLQASKLASVAEKLESIKQDTLDRAAAPESELGIPVSIEQLAMINQRDLVPFMAIFWYGHGDKPPEFREITVELMERMRVLREASIMLLNYMDRYFEGNEVALIIPNTHFLEGSLWRTRIMTGLYLVATFYRLTAESLDMALKSLEAAPLEGKSLIHADKRKTAVEMLKTTQMNLNEAAMYLAIATTELGKDEERWLHAQSALSAILG